LHFKFDERKKYLYLIAVVLFVLVVVYRIKPFLVQLTPSNDEIILKEATLVKYRKIIRKKGALETALKALAREVKNAEKGLLSDKTASLAAVEIQNILTEIAAKNNVEIRRVQVLKPEKASAKGYMLIPVRFSLNTTIRQLKKIMCSIEREKKYLIFKKVVIRVIRIGPINSTGTIRSDLTLYGIMKKTEN